MTERLTFVVGRGDLRQSQSLAAPLELLESGEVRLKVDRFAFTANNVTYAELGDQFGFWRFFPAPEGWGTIPVWGFADVIESRHESIAVGERVFGFLPIATHLTVRPERVGDGNFVDATLHRRELPAAYNLYLRVAADPGYEPRFEDLQALLRPLFITSFLIDDLLADEDFFGARGVLLSSASSKTAIGLAHQLHSRQGAVEVIGVTSAGNRTFVEGLGCYDRTLTYDRIGELPSGTAAAYIDFAGSPQVRAAVHEHYGDSLKYSCSVGFSHRGQLSPDAGLPGPKPVFFFAADRLRKRAKDWGRDGIDLRFTAAWRKFVPTCESWLSVTRGQGRAEVERVYRTTLDGKVPPDCGQILSVWDGR